MSTSGDTPGGGEGAAEEMPGWMRDHVALTAAEQRQRGEALRAARLAKAKQRLARGRCSRPGARAGAAGSGGAGSRAACGQGSSDPAPDGDLGEDAAFLLDEWRSDDEGAGAKRKPPGCAARPAGLLGAGHPPAA